VRKYLLLFALLFCARVAYGQSCTTATCTAASTSQADILAALPSSGNTNATVVVNIPSGTSTWTGAQAINYTVPAAVTNLTIQGQTTVNCTGTAGTSSYLCTATNNTVITDATTPSNKPFFQINAAASQHVRFTGITYYNSSGGAPKYHGGIYFTGSQNLRLDHCSFNSTFGTAVYMVGIGSGIEGVGDHNVAIGAGGIFDITNQIGDNIGFGDGTWAKPTNFGTNQFWFSENNYLVGIASGSNLSGSGEDCLDAGAFVERYNTFLNIAAPLQDHATKTEGGRQRGCRAMEFYHNYITSTASGPYFAAGGMKGATALIWDNVVTAHAYNYFQGSSTDRNTTAVNETNPAGGWGWCGTTVKIEHGAGPSNGVGSAWDGNSNTATGYPCLDQIGRGMAVQPLDGQTFTPSGPGPSNSVTGCKPVTPATCNAWPQQYLEPVYMFMNTLPTGRSGEILIQDSVTANDRDYYYDCNSYNSSCSGGFTGEHGTGFGLLSARPSSCTAGPGGTFGQSPTGSYGVAYFATDANGGRGELDVCTSTNTWTPVYTPYTYPHPLETSGASTNTPPQPPAAFTATVQ
jgi:hypothetical protein